ncbi:M64 family metallopeptidase [Streptomyces sp. NPDC056402]|uniref:M64 family metallopeptidase n=1 Tax=Streptomyces sp. NPDC056402 TaxID=3345810 RepID=UPI0035D7C8FE
MGTADGRVIRSLKIIDNGHPLHRWNLVIMGDGYQEAQLSTFINDVQSLVNNLLGSAPFNRVPKAINIYRIDVSSTDSGADDPAACGGTGATPRTYFDATFCSYGNAQLLTVNDGTALTVARRYLPYKAQVLVLVNSTQYGGSGGPDVAVASRDPDIVTIVMHELAHSAFDLGDEYETYAGCGDQDDKNFFHPAVEPPYPNVTTHSNRATIKWRDLIAPTTRIPTTRNANCEFCDPQPNPVTPDTVGAFEGADYYHCGAFRPQFNCVMRGLRSPYCAVCARHIRRTLAPHQPVVVNRVAAVARTSGSLEVFWAAPDCWIWNNWWAGGPSWHTPFPIAIDERGPAAHNTSVAAVAPTPGRLDVFWAGNDGQIWSQYTEAPPGQGWRDRIQFPIAKTFPSPPALGTGVAAVSRFNGHLDVFWAGMDGQIWTNWWNSAPGLGWYDHPAKPIAATFLVFPAEGTGVAAVAQNSNRLDVFWVGSDGKIWSQYWERPGQDWKDHSIYPIATTFEDSLAPGTGVAAVSRFDGHLDVFWAGRDNQIWTNWWNRAPGQRWYDHDPFPIASAFLHPPPAPGTGVAAVARTSTHLDVFWAGSDGRIWNQWWDSAPGQRWEDHNPRPIGTSFPDRPAPGTGIAAVARTSTHLDVFWTGTAGKIWSNWWDQAPGGNWHEHPVFSL